MATFTVSSYAKHIELQNNSGSAAESVPAGGVYLFASGAAGSAKLYLQNEGGTAIDIANNGGDIDALDALGGATLHQTQDFFQFSDAEIKLFLEEINVRITI